MLQQPQENCEKKLKLMAFPKILSPEKIVCMQTIIYFASMKTKGTSDRMEEAKGQKKSRSMWDRDCGDEWTRTTDSRIFSPMLYQLSYITVV
jgi:hypothetical protein